MLDLSRDALARVSAGGRILPANQAMRDLLDHWSHEVGAEVRNLGEIPVVPEDREGFDSLTRSSGGRCTVHIGEEARQYELELCTDRGGALLALRDAGSQEECLRLLRSTERLHALAALAEGLVHDLNNLLGVAAGFSEHLASTVRNPDERLFLEAMTQGTRTGAEFTASLLRLLRQPTRAREVVSLPEVVGEAVTLFRTSARLSGHELHWQPPESDLLVRVVPEEIIQCVLHMLLFSRASSPAGKPIRISVQGDVRLSDRPRNHARVLVEDHGDPADGRLLQQMLAHPRRDVLEVARRISGDGRALLQSSLTMLCYGGSLRYDGGDDDGRSISLYLPTARGR